MKSNKGIIISIIIWLIFLIIGIISKYPLNEIIYVQTGILAIILSIFSYIAGLKKYRKIPIKTIQAEFVKTYGSVERYRWDNNGEPEYRNIDVDLYKYELNGKKGEYRLKHDGYAPRNITLYYKKGKKDITHNESNLNIFPLGERIKRELLIFPGSIFITFIILNFIFKIPIDF